MDSYMIYQPFFKRHMVGFEQRMVFAPAQMRFYHFYMPEGFLSEGEFVCVPDGCVDIVFVDDGAEGRVQLIGSPVARKALACYPGSRYFGVRLSPGVFVDIGDVSLADVTDNEIVYTGRAFGTEAFFERLRGCAGLSEKAELFMRELAPRVTDAYLPPHVRAIIGAINASKGRLSVAELSESLCYSERQIRRQLAGGIGIGPKTLSRIVRFQNALHRMISDPALDNALCIAELDYADQAHFQREFKEFTGVSPKEFRRAQAWANGAICAGPAALGR